MHPPESRQRRYPRVREPGLGGRLPSRSEARLLDISLGGARFETETPLSRGARYRITLHNAGADLERAVRLVWNQLTTTRRRNGGDVAAIYRSGVQFTEASSGADELLEFIHDHQPVAKPDGDVVDTQQPLDEAPRTSTRYELAVPTSITLEIESSYVVKTLSQSGMLIETATGVGEESAIDLVLELPTSEIRARGRVVTSEPVYGQRTRRFQVAIEFVELAESDRQDLGQFVSSRLH